MDDTQDMTRHRSHPPIIRRAPINPVYRFEPRRDSMITPVDIEGGRTLALHNAGEHDAFPDPQCDQPACVKARREGRC